LPFAPAGFCAGASHYKVDFAGSFARCVLDDPDMCEVNRAVDDLVIDSPVPLPDGYRLLPGILHAYRASTSDLAGYVEPGRHNWHRHED